MEECHSNHRNPSWVRDGDNGQTLEENWLFRLRRERYRSRASGQSHDFYVVHLADAVNVVALTPDRRLILVEQFRAGSGRDSLETPGGLLEPGEDPRDAGARELREETGYTGDSAVVLGTSWANSSILSSRITTILITNAVPSAEASPDEGEEVRLACVPASRLPALIRSGRIDHALAVQGLLLWMVSELPGHALSYVSFRRKYQISIASTMVFTAVCAVVLGLVRGLGFKGLFALSGGSALLISAAVIFLIVDPARPAVLHRSIRGSIRRKALRLLATFGLGTIIWWFVILLIIIIR